MSTTTPLDRDTVEKLGSAGFAAKGLLYVTIGALAASVGVGGGSGGASQSGAIQRLSQEAYGTVILTVLAVGLAGYALLRAIHVVANPSGEDGAKGAVMRASYAFRALVYGGLTFQTVKELAGSSSGGGNQEQELTQRVLELPGGAVIVGGVALVLFGVAAYQAKAGLTRDFMEHFRSSGRAEQVAEWTGAVGHLARAVLFGTIGVLLGQAALESDASESGGMSQAFQELADTAAGTALLTIVAAGVAVYGVYCFLMARWGTARTAG